MPSDPLYLFIHATELQRDYFDHFDFELCNRFIANNLCGIWSFFHLIPEYVIKKCMLYEQNLIELFNRTCKLLSTFYGVTYILNVMMSCVSAIKFVCIWWLMSILRVFFYYRIKQNFIIMKNSQFISTKFYIIILLKWSYI